MPLVEAVTIGVGSAIAKSILKLWLKDSKLEEDVSSSLIDLLKSWTSDTLAQRRGHRQLERIGEMVGESLLPLFESEGPRLDDSGRTAIALAVAEAFNKSKLSSELLAKRNLEPTELAKHVLAAHPTATELFSAPEIALYQRIIEESCIYIVDIASQLPAFTEHTFGEVLKREDQLIARTDQILKEIRRVREQLNPLVEAGRLEIDYRLAVARNLDVLQLLGTDISTANRRHRLSVAYITLSVAQKSHGYHTLAAKTHEGSQDETDRDIVSVDKALSSSQRLLIHGSAGSGKTTLLQWIAVKSASRTFDGYLSGWNDTLPFYIRLRHCIQSGLPSPEAFSSLVAPVIADTMPKGWVHAALKLGRAIVLVDGVDEVPVLQRDDVRTWLRELVETYPRARFIITSRPHAVGERWMSHEGFSDAELQPMQLSDVYTFIDHWHKAVQEELLEDEEKAELEPLAKHLKEDVRRNHSIRNLATNPLLCAMLCALNRERRQQLPTNRIELYEACCSLLLERRDKERRIELTDYPTLNYSQKRRLLEDLAYWMIKNNWSEAALELVDERFDRKLKNMPGVSKDISGSGVRRLFVERASIIREPVAGQIDFTHRTFQEFLAAKAALDEMDIGVLVTNAHNDQWREVIILASGFAAQPMCEKLIKDLIARGDKEKKYQYQLYLLAVSCLETSVELGQKVRVEVDKRLNKLVPPKNMADAEALAAAGDLAVKYLAKGRYPVSTAAPCIRTLALIASDAALEMLEGYANDTTVIAELLRAWDAFDRETYARNVLSHLLRNRVDLRLERLPSLDGIQYFTNLTSLNLSGCSQVSDLSPLASLTQLTSLDLSSCSRLSDLSLTGLKQLILLNLSHCSHLSTLSLMDLTQLTSLDLSHFSRLSTLSLTGLKQLASLNLSYCTQVNTLSLTDLTQLTSLDLSHCFRLGTLSLTGLKQLASLNLSYCTQVNTLSLTDLMQLTSLNLSGCSQVSDLSPLAGLTQLTSLDLSGCSQVSDLSPLAGLKRLTSLNLFGCTQVNDLSALTKLNSLEKLDLGGTLDKVTIPLSIKERVEVIFLGET